MCNAKNLTKKESSLECGGAGCGHRHGTAAVALFGFSTFFTGLCWFFVVTALNASTIREMLAFLSHSPLNVVCVPSFCCFGFYFFGCKFLFWKLEGDLGMHNSLTAFGKSNKCKYMLNCGVVYVATNACCAQSVIYCLGVCAWVTCNCFRFGF